MNHPFKSAPDEGMIVNNDYALTVKMFFLFEGVAGGCGTIRRRALNHFLGRGPYYTLLRT
jgi:hypothetical protein